VSRESMLHGDEFDERGWDVTLSGLAFHIYAAELLGMRSKELETWVHLTNKIIKMRRIKPKKTAGWTPITSINPFFDLPPEFQAFAPSNALECLVASAYRIESERDELRREIELVRCQRGEGGAKSLKLTPQLSIELHEDIKARFEKALEKAEQKNATKPSIEEFRREVSKGMLKEDRISVRSMAGECMGTKKYIYPTKFSIPPKVAEELHTKVRAERKRSPNMSLLQCQVAVCCTEAVTWTWQTLDFKVIDGIMKTRPLKTICDLEVEDLAEILSELGIGSDSFDLENLFEL